MKKTIRSLVLICFCCICFTVSAQPPPPPPPGNVGAPIDTDITLFLVVATAYGAYKLYSRKTLLNKPNI